MNGAADVGHHSPPPPFFIIKKYVEIKMYTEKKNELAWKWRQTGGKKKNLSQEKEMNKDGNTPM